MALKNLYQVLHMLPRGNPSFFNLAASGDCAGRVVPLPHRTHSHLHLGTAPSALELSPALCRPIHINTHISAHAHMGHTLHGFPRKVWEIHSTCTDRGEKELAAYLAPHEGMIANWQAKAVLRALQRKPQPNHITAQVLLFNQLKRNPFGRVQCHICLHLKKKHTQLAHSICFDTQT